MALQQYRVEFIFGLVIAMVVTILAMTTWAAPSNPESDLATPIPPIYRPNHQILH